MNSANFESGAKDAPDNTIRSGLISVLQSQVANRVQSDALTNACWTWDPVPQALAREGTSPNYPLASSGGSSDPCPFLQAGSIDFYEAAVFWQTTAKDDKVVSLRIVALQRGYYHWFWRTHELVRDDGNLKAFFPRPDVARFGLSEFSVNVQLVQASGHPVLIPLPAAATCPPKEITHAK